MEIQKCRGIVLSSRVIGEADYLINFFTKEYGKRDFIFKGLKKSKRRPAIVSEPGTIADLLCYFREEKYSYIVNDFKIVKHDMKIRVDFKKILLLYYFVETCGKTSGYNDPNAQIFELIVSGLKVLSDTENTPILSAFFIIHLLKLHGILPDYCHCKICGSDNCKDYYLDSNDIHLVCEKCARENGKTVNISRAMRILLRQSIEQKFNQINPGTFPESEILNLVYHLTLFIESYYNIEIKSKNLLFAEFKKMKY